MIEKKKITIIGLPGSGKSTLGRKLGDELNLPYYPEPLLDKEITEGVPNWVITKVITDKLFHFHRNLVGVFECLPGYSKYIFLEPHERIRLPCVCNPGEYDYIIALNPPLETIKERIKKRNRDNLVSIELAQTEERYKRYLKMLNSLCLLPNLYILSDNHIEIVKEIIQWTA